MPSYWRHVNRVIQNTDIVIEVLDARMVEQTRNKEIEAKITQSGKKLLYVLNKCDLMGKEEMKTAADKLYPSVFVSSTNKLGTTVLKKKIMELGQGKKVTVGIVGYPNVGKSSLINALSGRHAARTSASSGFTRGIQKVIVGPKIILLDTPGVFPDKEKDELKHGATGAIDFAKLKDPEAVAIKIIEENKEVISEFYDVEEGDADEMLESIGRSKHKLSVGDVVNLDITSRLILKDWQRGKIRK